MTSGSFTLRAGSMIWLIAAVYVAWKDGDTSDLCIVVSMAFLIANQIVIAIKESKQ